MVTRQARHAEFPDGRAAPQIFRAVLRFAAAQRDSCRPVGGHRHGTCGKRIAMDLWPAQFARTQSGPEAVMKTGEPKEHHHEDRTNHRSLETDEGETEGTLGKTHG